jgi:hypothetical protein
MLLVQKDHCHQRDVILPLADVAFRPSISLPRLTTLPCRDIGYSFVTSFCITDNLTSPSPRQGTMSPCHHNNMPFCFRASLLFDVLQFVLHNLPTFLCFFMHPSPLSNPLTFLVLLQCIHHWSIASIRYNYCKCFYRNDPYVCIAQFEGLAFLVLWL